MIFSKKSVFSLLASVFTFAAFFIFTGNAYAMTPSLSFSNINGSNVEVDVVGDPNSSVVFYYQSTSQGLSIEPIGTTAANGTASIVLNSTQYNIASGGSTYVVVDGQQSQAVAWPNISASVANTAVSFSQTSLVMTVGQTTTVTINPNDNTGTLYISNNSNPAVTTNVGISGDQITFTALSVGSSVLTVCPLNQTTNCGSLYVTVPSQNNSSIQPITFNQNNITVANGQTVPITISGGTGSYTILTNSNSSVITASLINGNTINLYGTGTGGSASITVCSSDMSSCGIINATIGAVSTTGVTFSQTYPTLATGQTLPISISGGSGTYTISSNSNPSVVSPTISGNTLNLYGDTTGTATITVCSTSGSCSTITPTVSYTATGGAMSLSQSSITLLLGQTLSVTVSGGEAPYSLATPTVSGIFQSSLSNNIINITGLSAGSSILSVCSAGGGCVGLSVTVNSAGVGSGNLQPAFSQNNFSMTAGQNASVSFTGTGEYYVTTNTNPSVASYTLTGSGIIITANSLGSTNITVCQSGGQCNILSMNVISSNGSISSTANPIFSPNTVTLSTGQNTTVSVSGGASNYYSLASNSNPNAAQVTISGNILTVTGVSSGSAIAVVCASSNSCSPLFITVNAESVASVITFSPVNPTVEVGQSAYVTMSGASSYSISSSINSYFNANINGDLLVLNGVNSGSASVTICSNTGNCQPLFVTVTSVPVQTPVSTPIVSSGQYIFSSPIRYGERSYDVTELQTRLTQLGVYNGPITGYFGSLTYAAVIQFQAENGLQQVGSVGPLTRALLNK